MPGAQLPTRELELVYHVGTLRPEDKGRRSYEGDGLSVSLHPEEWAAIARLGDTIWALHRAGARFLLAHRLDEDQRAGVISWGAARGWVVHRRGWQISLDDDELGGRVSLRCLDEDEAAAEEASGAAEIVACDVLVATPLFEDLTVQDGTIDPYDPLLAAWVARTRPELDGVWWDDRYDPAAYSCPRGVIAPGSLHRWRRQPLASRWRARVS